MAQDTKKTKFFRIATEGATTDGRTIDRAMLEQMARTYDPAVYGARINMEHIRGLYPDGAFRAYGDVIALKAEEQDGKMRLFAQLSPTKDLIAMTTEQRQKVYTSM
ncbi:GPO family capsid scaffolding protein, partial [Burkholderia multivorans]